VTPLSLDEFDAIREAVQKCVPDLPHQIADITGFSLYWDESMVKSGTLGAYHWYFPADLRISTVGKHALDLIVPVVCHELRHAWQHQTMGVAYLAKANRLWARWTIEPSAYEVERAAEKILGQEQGVGI